MLVGVGIVFGKLIALPARAHHMTPVQTRHPRAAVTAFLDIVFTFGGQVSASRLLQLQKSCFAASLVCSQLDACCQALLHVLSFLCHACVVSNWRRLQLAEACCLQSMCRTMLQCNLLSCLGSHQDCCWHV